MRYSCNFSLIILVFIFIFYFTNCSKYKNNQEDNLYVGWATEDITPKQPVLLWGEFHARISEKVMDPITVTALAFESRRESKNSKVIMVSCDLLLIGDKMRSNSNDNLLDKVRERINKIIPELSYEDIILNATHTHNAPVYGSDPDEKRYGIKLDAMPPSECEKYIIDRIVEAISKAWKRREPGGISYGLGQAVVGRNRIQVDHNGISKKGGSTNRPEFSHIEGYEDHSVNLIYTWTRKRELSGIIINMAATPQVTGDQYFISSDFWHETRLEIQKHLGKHVHILPQCSAAGDQGTIILVGDRAEQRMHEIDFPVPESVDRVIRSRMGRRKQIAKYITDAVLSVYSSIKEHIDWDPEIIHRMESVILTRRLISVEEVNVALKEAEEYKKQYNGLLQKINKDPEITNQTRWYRDITRAFALTNRGHSVKERYELEKQQPKLPVEIHVIRIGDIVFATNPFELYLDYGLRIKARSPAIQTFIIQLAGSGTYVPTSRSVAGGAYGAVPASTLIGPEGGQELVEKTLEIINDIFTP